MERGVGYFTAVNLSIVMTPKKKSGSGSSKNDELIFNKSNQLVPFSPNQELCKTKYIIFGCSGKFAWGILYEMIRDYA